MSRAPAAVAVAGLALLAACRDEAPRDPVHLAALTPASARGLADQTRPRLLSLDLQDETLEALVAPVPSRLDYELRVPERGVLSFAVARSAAGEAPAAGAIRFRLHIQAGAEERLLFDSSLPPRKAERWFPATLDVSAWSGQTVRLRLETDSDRPLPGTLALWGHPLLAARPSKRHERLILLVSIDCLRADHVGSYGYARDTTPHIDRLAADGVVFENAIAAATSTLFSHTSMLTGLPPSLHGARRERRLSGSVDFLPELLTRAGWETEGFAAWVLVSGVFGFDRGYHAYRVEREHDGPKLIDAVLARLQHEVPSRFVFLHLFEPHWPYLPAAGWRDRFGPRPADISELLAIVGGDRPPRGEEREQVMRLYDAEVAFTDAQLGRLLDALRERGLYDEALIVVTADHGEAFFEHGHWEHTETLFEEIVHVPLIVKWPRSLGIAGGQRVPDPVGQIDIYATVLEAAGVAAPTPEARSLLHTLRAGGGDRVIVSEVAWHRPDHTVLHVALRGHRYKYIARLEGPAEPEFQLELRGEQLYDLESDPAERHDRIADPPVDLGLLRGRLKEYLGRAHDVSHARRGDRIELDAATLRRLRALGYVH